jgi:hypothetical protein
MTSFGEACPTVEALLLRRRNRRFRLTEQVLFAMVPHMGAFGAHQVRRGCSLVALSVLAVVLIPAFAHGHGGGLAADGCHYNRSTGVRHCHRAPATTTARPTPVRPTPVPSITETLPAPKTATPSPGEAALWRGLRVAPERTCSDLEVPYPWEDGSYPQIVKDEIVRRLGGLWSPYDRQRFLVPGDVDIDQIVSMTEAHASGLCFADAVTQITFYTDLNNLTLASPRVNRVAKKDRDAADWLPEANRCWFAWSVLKTRLTYGLTIDVDEATALEAILVACEPAERVRPNPS